MGSDQGEGPPGWLKWYFIIGGSLFAVSLITMGIIFAVIGDGDMYDYDDDYEDDYYYDVININAYLYSSDDTLVIFNYGHYIDWDDYTVLVDGFEVTDYEKPYSYTDKTIFYLDLDIDAYEYYYLRIEKTWENNVVYESDLFSDDGYGSY